MAESATPPSKTLRQYRKEQDVLRTKHCGSDFEDFLLLSGGEKSLPEQALWRAVILQMVTDAISNSQKSDFKRFKRDARHWLTRHSRDFRLVCDHAGYDPDWLQEQINRFLAAHDSKTLPTLGFKQPICAPLKPKPHAFSISYQVPANTNHTHPFADHRQ